MGISPSMGASSRGTESPVCAAPKGTGKPQHCIFIDDKALANLCFGVIGMSGVHFCVAPKELHYTHCGLPAHTKGIRKRNKFKAKLGSFYVPGGSVHGRQTAKMDPSIARADFPGSVVSHSKWVA